MRNFPTAIPASKDLFSVSQMHASFAIISPFRRLYNTVVCSTFVLIYTFERFVSLLLILSTIEGGCGMVSDRG